MQLQCGLNLHPYISKKETSVMALAISHVPVLTGEVAERFEREAEYNEKYMRGSQYNPEAFEMVRLTISSAKFILFFEKVWLFQIKAVPLHQQIPPRFSSQDQRTRVGRFF